MVPQAARRVHLANIDFHPQSLALDLAPARRRPDSRLVSCQMALAMPTLALAAGGSCNFRTTLFGVRSQRHITSGEHQ